MTLKFNDLFKELDKILAVSVTLLSLAIYILLIFASNRIHSFVIAYMIISGLTVIYSSIYLLLRDNMSIIRMGGIESKRYFFFLVIIFIMNYLFSIYLIYNGMVDYQLSLYYYFSIYLMCAVIALEILYSVKKMQHIILFQIIILGLNISLSRLVIIPSITGSDPWWHSMITNQIVDTSFIPESPYQKLPIFHLLLAMTSIICNVDYKNAVIIAITSPQVIIGILFIYLITHLMFKRYKISLMSSLMLIIGNYFIQLNVGPIPNSLCILLLIITLYLLTKMQLGGNKLITIIVILLSTIILTHTLGALITALSLFACWFGSSIISRAYNIKRDNSIFLKIAVLFTITMLSWWIYVSSPFISLIEMIRNNLSIDYFLQSTQSQTSTYFTSSVTQLEQTLYLLGMLLIYSTAIIGIFFMISKRGNSSSFYIALLGIMFIIISFLGFLQGRYILNDRWYYISEIILSIPLSISLLILSNAKNNKKYKTMLIFTLVVILSFTNLIPPSLTPNTRVRYTFTKAETAAASYTVTNALDRISSDFFYAESPSSSIFETQFNISATRIRTLDQSLLNNQFQHDLTIKMIRTEIVNNPIVMGDGGILRLPADPNKTLIRSGFNKIYDNGGVKSYR